MTWVVLSLAILLLLGLPISIAFGLAGTIGLLLDDQDLLSVVTRMFAGLDSFVLMAAPFYIVAGEIMNRGGISERLIHLSQIMVGRIRGGTAYANVVSSVLFAGISGTAIADIAAIGKIFIVGMPKEGYTKEFAAAVCVASSIIGPIIPPSVIMVLYAAVAYISVLDLFLAAVIPGLLMGLSCFLMIAYTGYKKDLPKAKITVPRSEIPKLAIDGALVVSIPVFIVVGTLSGVFTPTEAGGIVVVYSAILGLFVFKSLDLKGLMTSMMSSGRLTAGIFLIIACSQVLNYVLVLGGIDQAAGHIVRLFDGQTFLFLLFCAFLFVLIGLALDAGAALLLLAPIMLPIARSMGIDDLHFSMVMILSTTLGLISPPVGIVLFVSCKIGEMRIRDLWKELGPFFYLHLAFLVILIAVPELSTFLPYYLRH